MSGGGQEWAANEWEQQGACRSGCDLWEWERVNGSGWE